MKLAVKCLYKNRMNKAEERTALAEFILHFKEEKFHV
jgi:hypothetical protein